MDEPKKIQLTSLSSVKTDKKKMKYKKAIRIKIDLPESNEKSCPEYNYGELLAKFMQQQRAADDRNRGDSSARFNPSDDESDEALQALARSLERKYGNVATKKKRKKTKERDFKTLGEGYDENDSFIDNTAAYDEVMDSNKEAKHGGFYINSGKLGYRELSESEDDSMPNTPQHSAKRKNCIDSDEEETAGEGKKLKEGSDDETYRHGSNQVHNGALDEGELLRKQRKLISKMNAKKHISKVRSQDPASSTPPAAVVPAATTASVDPTPATAPVVAAASVAVPASAPVSNESKSSVAASIESVVKKFGSSDERSHPASLPAASSVIPPTAATTTPPASATATLPAAATMPATATMPPATSESAASKADSNASADDDDSNSSSSSSSSSSDDSTSSSSDDSSSSSSSDAEASKAADQAKEIDVASVASQNIGSSAVTSSITSASAIALTSTPPSAAATTALTTTATSAALAPTPTSSCASTPTSVGASEKIVPLPENLSPDLIQVIEELKLEGQRATACRSSQKFFTEPVKTLLLSIETKLQEKGCRKKTQVYQHLSQHLPCGAQTLVKRAKQMLHHLNENKVALPLMRLKQAIEREMPPLVEAFAEQCRIAAQIQGTEVDLPLPPDEKKKIKMPKKHFVFSAESNAELLAAVEARVAAWETLPRKTAETAQEFLVSFLEGDVRTLWPRGWVTTRQLYRQSAPAHASITHGADYCSKPSKKSVAASAQSSVVVSSEVKVSSSTAPKDGLVSASSDTDHKNAYGRSHDTPHAAAPSLSAEVNAPLSRTSTALPASQSSLVTEASHSKPSLSNSNVAPDASIASTKTSSGKTAAPINDPLHLKSQDSSSTSRSKEVVISSASNKSSDSKLPIEGKNPAFCERQSDGHGSDRSHHVTTSLSSYSSSVNNSTASFSTASANLTGKPASVPSSMNSDDNAKLGVRFSSGSGAKSSVKPSIESLPTFSNTNALTGQKSNHNVHTQEKGHGVTVKNVAAINRIDGLEPSFERPQTLVPGTIYRSSLGDTTRATEQIIDLSSDDEKPENFSSKSKNVQNVPAELPSASTELTKSPTKNMSAATLPSVAATVHHVAPNIVSSSSSIAFSGAPAAHNSMPTIHPKVHTSPPTKSSVAAMRPSCSPQGLSTSARNSSQTNNSSVTSKLSNVSSDPTTSNTTNPPIKVLQDELIDSGNIGKPSRLEEEIDDVMNELLLISKQKQQRDSPPRGSTCTAPPQHAQVPEKSGSLISEGDKFIQSNTKKLSSQHVEKDQRIRAQSKTSEMMKTSISYEPHSSATAYPITNTSSTSVAPMAAASANKVTVESAQDIAYDRSNFAISGTQSLKPSTSPSRKDNSPRKSQSSSKPSFTAPHVTSSRETHSNSTHDFRSFPGVQAPPSTQFDLSGAQSMSDFYSLQHIKSDKLSSSNNGTERKSSSHYHEPRMQSSSIQRLGPGTIFSSVGDLVTVPRSASDSDTSSLGDSPSSDKFTFSSRQPPSDLTVSHSNIQASPTRAPKHPYSIATLATSSSPATSAHSSRRESNSINNSPGNSHAIISSQHSMHGAMKDSNSAAYASSSSRANVTHARDLSSSSSYSSYGQQYQKGDSYAKNGVSTSAAKDYSYDKHRSNAPTSTNSDGDSSYGLMALQQQQEMLLHSRQLQQQQQQDMWSLTSQQLHQSQNKLGPAYISGAPLDLYSATRLAPTQHRSSATGAVPSHLQTTYRKSHGTSTSSSKPRQKR
ncbi:ubinuclein-1 isoform X2 [Hyalella azteca]|uniref:Ubinuclein-1 isoform X2 n=1 Tax=Hyalella azteca TaxID=294128 RepID=A0A8B7NQE1_HYAAZ|nr:ubinuclein-1 isoform X2 [Hyalella azteca]